ncbi:MAG: glycosyltransferase family 2 protein [Phycisphaerales bacterium]|nr:glycosyltransferase family 2 protein [Phycisphaerales bacterium]MCB9863628.1 glycosyltransferase family 2 protein [Phycisphaerales bacterium]
MNTAQRQLEARSAADCDAGRGSRIAIFVGVAVLVLAVLRQDSFWHAYGSGSSSAVRWIAGVYAAVMLGAFAWRIVLWLRYRADAPVNDDVLPRISVVIPAYNEGPMVREAILSAARSDIPRDRLEIIAVDDGSDDDTWRHIREAASRAPAGVQLVTHRLPENRGKREALSAGFAMASGDVFVTLDSDSVLERDALRNLVAPIVRDVQIDCVAGCVRVLNSRASMITRLLKCYFSLSFRFVRAYQNGFRGIFCAPGAISAYRASAIRRVLSDWREQAFLGRPCVTGEDRSLTNLVMRGGGLTAYQQTAVAHTAVPETYSGMAKMFLRWARSNIRETIILWRFMWRPFRERHVGLFRFNMVLVLMSLLLPYFFVSHSAALFLTSDGFMLQYVMAVVFGGLLMGAIYYRNERDGDWIWLVFYQFFWVVFLSWILPYAAMTLRNTGWLTRGSTDTDSKEAAQRVSSPDSAALASA